MPDRDLSGSNVGNEHGNKEGADTSRPFFQKVLELLLVGGHSANTRSMHHSDSQRINLFEIKP